MLTTEISEVPEETALRPFTSAEWNANQGPHQGRPMRMRRFYFQVNVLYIYLLYGGVLYHVWGTESNLWESALSFKHMDSRDQTQVTRSAASTFIL